VGADTDGVMDRCDQCGARGKIAVVDLGADCTVKLFRGECTECAEAAAPPDENANIAAILWNKRQRMAAFARECNVTAGVLLPRQRGCRKI
jgi:hypothetical protein